MKITVRTFAALGEALGARELSIEVPAGQRIGALLQGLCTAHPALGPLLFDEAGRIRPHILVLKNGRSIPPPGPLDTLLAEGDAIALFPAVGGG